MRLLHFAFMTNAEEARRDRAALCDLCAAYNLEAPAEGAKHHLATLEGIQLRWEQHSEFTTYSLAGEGGPNRPFEPTSPPFFSLLQLIGQPGLLLVRVDLHLVSDQGGLQLDDIFDVNSVAISEVAEHCALVATDFLAREDGVVRILAIDRGLSPIRAGALVRRVLEIETYRTLSLLGLPEAQRLAPRVSAAETQLA